MQHTYMCHATIQNESGQLSWHLTQEALTAQQAMISCAASQQLDRGCIVLDGVIVTVS